MIAPIHEELASPRLTPATKKWALALALCVASLASFESANGQTPASPSPPLMTQAGTVFEGVGKLFSNIDSIQYRARVINAAPGRADFVTEVQYTGAGQKFRWTVRRPEPSTGLLKEYTAAYDGETGYYLRAHMGLLEIHKHQRPNDFELMGYTGPLEMFRFFLADVPRPEDTPVNLPTLEQFRQGAFWSDLTKKSLKIENAQWAGKNVLAITLPGGLMPSRVGETVYRLYFPTEGGITPLGWERLWNSGNYRETYSIEELGRAKIPGAEKEFVFPKVAVHRGFWGGSTQPSFTETITVETLSLNTSSSESFEVDPGEAQQIEDMETKTFIPVPK